MTKLIEIKKDNDTTLIPSSKISLNGGGDVLSNLTNYSYNEQYIGLWIDGNPIYRRVILIGLLTPESKTVYSTGLPSCSIIRYEGMFNYNSTNYFSLNHLNMYNRTPDNYEGILAYFTNHGKDFIVENAHVSETKLYCWVIVDYVKL